RYRQEILGDLLTNPEIIAGLERTLPLLMDLSSYTTYKRAQDTPFHQTILRLAELDIYVDAVQKLASALSSAPIRAEGLIALRDFLVAAKNQPFFQELVTDLPALNERIRSLKSISIGVNLDALLRPIEATLLSINTEKFKSESVMNRLLGRKSENEGIGP